MPRVTYFSLEKGELTTQTITEMQRIIKNAFSDWQVVVAARNVVRDVDGHDFDGEVNQIFEFCRDAVRYRRDPVGCELLQTPLRTMKELTGDCDDKTILFCSLAGALGHKTRLVLESVNGRTWAHVRADVLMSGKWIAADPTPETAPLGWKSPNVKKRGYVNL